MRRGPLGKKQGAWAAVKYSVWEGNLYGLPGRAMLRAMPYIDLPLEATRAAMCDPRGHWGATLSSPGKC